MSGTILKFGEFTLDCDQLWEREVFVDTEHGINTAVRKMRQVLRDSSRFPSTGDLHGGYTPVTPFLPGQPTGNGFSLQWNHGRGPPRAEAWRFQLAPEKPCRAFRQEGFRSEPRRV